MPIQPLPSACHSAHRLPPTLPTALHLFSGCAISESTTTDTTTSFPFCVASQMLSMKCPAQLIQWGWKPIQLPSTSRNVIVCAAKGPRPRFPRVWKTNRRIGTISKSKKLVDCIRGLSNVKEEVYGALDAFVAWELEFPLITVKKALKTLEDDKEWKRIIQMTKWMFSKGQGRTMGSYYTLLNALAEDGRIDEAEEMWTKLFSEHLESMPRVFFDKMISIYYSQGKHDKMFEVFADMEELGIRPTHSIVLKVGDVFRKLGMFDKFERLNRKYPPPRWEYRYIKGKRVKVRAKHPNELKAGNDSGEPKNEVYEKSGSDDEVNRYNQDSVEQPLGFPNSGRGGSVESNQTGSELDESNVTS